MKISSSEKRFSGKGNRFAVAVADFNAPITDALLAGCIETLREAGAAAPTVVRVPGAFELPLACLRLARRKSFSAVIALGCVIQGETPHNEYISMACAQGLMKVGLDTGIPAIFGVLTPRNEKQAWARAKGEHNKGREAALAALQMAAL
jgi:6,7-dimethyl-8-ribityllumazine synthase